MTVCLPPFYAGIRQAVSPLLVLLLLLTGPMARAQAPLWETVVGNAGSTTGLAELNASTADARGNVYVTGHFAGTVRFGQQELISEGSGDVFVAKWSRAAGQYVWAVRAGGYASEHATSIAVSGTSVYVAGDFGNVPATFGPVSISNLDGDRDGFSRDIFVAKLQDEGSRASFVWALRAGGVYDEYVGALAAKDDNVYMCGRFNSPSITLGGLALSNTNTNGFASSYVVKLHDAGATGTFVWAQRGGGSGPVWGTSLALSGTSVYMGGSYYEGSVSFGAITLPNSGANDAYVAKLQDEGSTSRFVWAQRAGGSGSEQVDALVVAAATVYMAGSFSSRPASFGPTSLTPAGGNDIFVAKLIDEGSTSRFGWAQQAGGASLLGTGDKATAVAVSGKSLYLAGSFHGTHVSFGSTMLHSLGSAEAFLARLQDEGGTGRFVWAKSVGGQEFDVASSLALDGPRVYLAGVSKGALRFDNLSYTGSPAGTYSTFLASLTDNTLLASSAAPSAALSLIVTPNPARGAALLRLPAVSVAGPARLVLRDALGRTVLARTAWLPAAGLAYELPLASLRPGIYALQVQAGAAVAVQRLVVE